MMTFDEMKAGMLKRPKDFMYYGELDLKVWGFSPFGQGRDSDLLTQSNFDYVVKELDKVSVQSVQVERFNHWACGWVETIMVRTTAKKTMARLYELYEAHEEYPVFDEEDLSAREYERAWQAYDAWAQSEVRDMAEREGITRLLDEEGYYSPSEADEETIRGIVANEIMDYDSFDCSYNDESLISALWEAFPVFMPDVTTGVLDFS